MTRNERLEALARKATEIVKVDSEETRQAVANALETEIDSYDPIQEGEYLVLARTIQNGERPANSIDLLTDAAKGKYTTYIIAWGSASKVESKLLWHYHYTHSQEEAERFDNFKRQVLAEGEFIGTL